MGGRILDEECGAHAEAGRSLKYLTPDHVLFIHQEIIARFGGSHGLRDRGLLESAVYRCQATFGGSDLYPDIWTKAAALLHGLLKNHAFVDGNKRTSHEATERLLSQNGHALEAPIDEMIAFLLDVEANRLTVDKMAAWLKSHSSTSKRTRIEP